jgi:hypothetical protein
MKFNVIYTNNGPRTPSGGTNRQGVAGLSTLSVYYSAIQPDAQAAPAGNKAAAAVIQSNGENIANITPYSNPLPPGVTQ